MTSVVPVDAIPAAEASVPATSVAPAPRVQGTDAAREAETIVDSDARNEFLDAALHALGSRVVVTEVERIRELLASHHHAFSREQEPFAVLLPGSAHEVSVILRLADERRIAVFTRGAGTGLGGLSTIDRPGVLLLTDRLNRIRCINPLGHYAVVEAGVVNARINDVAAQYGLWYAPDPVSRDRSTIGGNVATNAGGINCAKYGVTRDSVLSLTVVLPDGRIIETGRPTMKNVAGFDLTSLFTGSEGLLGVVVAVTVRLLPIPQGASRIVVFASDLDRVGDALDAALAAPVRPASMELMSAPPAAADLDIFGEAAQGTRWLIEITTDGSAAIQEADVLQEALRKAGATAIRATDAQSEAFLGLRKAGKAFPRGKAWMAGSDVAVPLDHLSDFLRNLGRWANDAHARLTVLAHLADGNTHTGFILPKRSSDETMPPALVEANRRLFDYVLANGGTITGEHGIGLELKDRLSGQIGEDNLALQRAIKRTIDPHGILNPGKWV